MQIFCGKRIVFKNNLMYTVFESLRKDKYLQKD